MSKKYFFVVSFLCSCLALFCSTSAVALAPGLPISHAAVGDYNMDGWLDIALTSENGLILVYLERQPDGYFLEQYVESYCGGYPNVMGQADFNRDGLLDLVVGDTYGKIKFMLNAGEGKFVIKDDKTILGVSPRDFIIFDFNADGKLDIAFADYYYNAISFLYGKDVMEFDGPTSYPVPSPSAIAAADFDNDGLTDIVVTSEGSNALYFLKQIEGKFEKKSQIQTGSRPVNIAVADFNHDNILDIVVVNKNSNNISLYRGKLEASSYSWQSPTTYSVGGMSPSYASIADFNSDGYLDIAVACEGSNAVYFLLSTGLGNFTLSDKTLSTDSHPIQVLATDFDNNGKSDLLTVNRGDQTVSTFKDEDISTKLGFRLPEMDIKVNGEQGPMTISYDPSNFVDISGSLIANDCQGMLSDFYLTIKAITSAAEAKAETKTYYITTSGLVEEEAPFVEDWPIENVPDVPLWSISPMELGVGYYEVLGKLAIKDNLTYYVSNAASFSIVGPSIATPCTVDVKINGKDSESIVWGGTEDIIATGTVEANDCLGMPAFAYLYIESRWDEVDPDNETLTVWYCRIRKYTTEGWESTEKKKCEEMTGEDIDPFIGAWPVTDVKDYPLFHFPSTYLEQGLTQGTHWVNVGLIVKVPGGMDFSVFDDAKLEIK